MLPAMREELLRIRGFLVMAAAIAALLLAAGCGGGSNDAGSTTVGDITVQTGSFSEDEFKEKADKLCKEARREFSGKYSQFLAAHEQEPQPVLIKNVVKAIVLPHFEKEIQQISELGAPQNYASEVGSYLNALKQRIDEGQTDPVGLIMTPNTFKEATALAKKAGLNGCAESLN